jgi:hypothetical protein
VESAVSPAVRTFIQERITSPNQVPVLLWLWSHPGQRITAAAVASSVGLSETQCTDVLEELVEAELAARADPPRRLYTYRHAGETMDQMLSELAVAYAEQRVDVLGLIADSAMARIRTAAVRSFVDCQNIVLTSSSGPNGRRR